MIKEKIEQIEPGWAERVMNWVLYGKPGEYPTGKERFEQAHKHE